jgi:hypothetical protein
MSEKENYSKETNEGRDAPGIQNDEKNRYYETNNFQQPLIENFPSGPEIDVNHNYPPQNIPSGQPVYNPNQPYTNYQSVHQQFNQPNYNQQQPFYGQNPHPQQGYQQFTNSQQGGYVPQCQPQYIPSQPHSGNNIIVVQQPVSPQYVLVSELTHGYPRLTKANAVVILLLNIFFPGLGSVIMGCISPGAEGFICIGILQFFLVPLFLIGWVWSIITGLNALKYARPDI